jgi:hypothetical protein
MYLIFQKNKEKMDYGKKEKSRARKVSIRSAGSRPIFQRNPECSSITLWQRQKRSRDKSAYPDAEAHFEKRVVTVLVKINHPQSPDEQKGKHHITEELNIRHHTQKQVDYIYFSEQRSIVQKTFYPIHSENSLFLRS